MEPDSDNVPLVNTPDTDTLFEGHKRGLDGINRCVVVAQNQNDPSFKNGWIAQRLSYIDILHEEYDSYWWPPFGG